MDSFKIYSWLLELWLIKHILLVALLAPLGVVQADRTV